MTSRRNLLIAGAAGAAGIAGSMVWWRNQQSVTQAPLSPAFTPDAAFPNRLRVPGVPGADGFYGVHDVAGAFTLSAKSVMQEIVPGKPATLLAYEVESQGKRLLNPLIRLRSGGKINAKFWNGIEETSIIHWHGLMVDSNNDGHPHYAVAGGATYDYSFAVPNRAATYWYHPHPHHLTGKQVYLGLGGLFIVEDDEELALQKALDLKLGVTDIPLVLHDRRIDAQGHLVFNPTDEDKADGFLGSQVLVNWTPKPHLEVSTRIYRFRILNASNARLYKLAFRSGEQWLDFQLIGNDGGLIDSARKIKEVFLSTAERIDVLLDLRNARIGDAITLSTVAFDPMEHEDGPPAADKPAEPPKDLKPADKSAHAMHGAESGKEAGKEKGAAPADANNKEKSDIPEIGVALELMRIHVRHKETYDRAVPAMLSRIEPIVANCASPRIISLNHIKMVWRINGQTYQDEKTPITVKRGAMEVWNIRNAAASMPHPFHIHGFQFQVLERIGSPEQQKKLAIDAGNKGLAASDLGWKDTVLVWPGETVCIAINFTHPFNGDQVYMIHCHNLEHEDQGMMLNLKVQA